MLAQSFVVEYCRLLQNVELSHHSRRRDEFTLRFLFPQSDHLDYLDRLITYRVSLGSCASRKLKLQWGCLCGTLLSSAVTLTKTAILG